jgi:hypothetical protein
MPLGGEEIKKKLFPMRGLVARGQSKFPHNCHIAGWIVLQYDSVPIFQDLTQATVLIRIRQSQRADKRQWSFIDLLGKFRIQHDCLDCPIEQQIDHLTFANNELS